MTVDAVESLTERVAALRLKEIALRKDLDAAPAWHYGRRHAIRLAIWELGFELETYERELALARVAR